MAQLLVRVDGKMDDALKRLDKVKRLAVQATDVETGEGVADAVLTIIDGIKEQWREL